MAEAISSARPCDSCKRQSDGKEDNTVDENDDIPVAVSWCHDCSDALCAVCTKCHKSIRLTQNHHVIPIQQYTEDVKAGPVFCERHSDKKLELYCRDHDAAICVICMAEGHRKCDNVQLMEAAANELCNPKAVSETQKRLERKSRLLSKIEKDRKRNISTLREGLQENKASMQDSLHKSMEKLKQLHYEVEIELQQKADNNIGNTESEIQTIQDYKSLTDKNVLTVQRIDTLSPYVRIHSLKKIEKEQNEIDDALEQMRGKYMNVTLSCTENELIADLAKQQNFATITEDNVPSEVLCTGTPQFPVASLPVPQHTKPSELKVFNVKGAGSITGAVFLKDGRILLSDCGRHSIFLCDSNGNVVSTLDFETNCWGISRLSDKSFITTNKSAVICFNINVSNLNIITRVPVDWSVDGRSIAYDNVDGGCVMVAKDKIVTIDRNGKLQDTIKLPDKPSCVTSVCKVGPKIWYGDQNNHSVHCMIIEGNKSTKNYTTYRADNLTYPRYICSDSQGRIYVAALGSHNIHQQTSEGKLQRILLSKEDGLDYPRVVVFQEDSSDTFLVSDNHTRVRIYKLT